MITSCVQSFHSLIYFLFGLRIIVFLYTNVKTATEILRAAHPNNWIFLPTCENAIFLLRQLHALYLCSSFSVILQKTGTIMTLCPLERYCKSIFMCWMWLFLQNSQKIRNCGNLVFTQFWLNIVTVWNLRGQRSGRGIPPLPFQMDIPSRGCWPWRTEREGESADNEKPRMERKGNLKRWKIIRREEVVIFSSPGKINVLTLLQSVKIRQET